VRTMLKLLLVLFCVLAFVVVASADYIPWLPDECQELRWWSHPAQAWRCIMAVMSELFLGQPGWEWGG